MAWERQVMKGGSGLSWSGDTGVLLPLWVPSPHPWGGGKAVWLSPHLAAVALGNFSSGMRRLCYSLGSPALSTLWKRV